MTLFVVRAMLLAGAVLGAGSGPRLAAATPDEIKYFEEHVRPILATRCFSCHGEEKQKGSLRLDARELLLSGGDSGPAISPGKPAESLLIEAINYESYEMPPDEKLPAEAIAALTTWIKMGAPWPEEPAGASVRKVEKITDEDRAYWAFQPVKKPAIPAVADEGWSRTAIDRFVFQRLSEASLTPAPAADRRTLIRRVTFDLIGLPPTPEEIDAFINDPSPVAYEQLVDRLLESPRYGEKWARHWLDLVRYAESDGFRQDAYRPHAWRYRDYVIRAFNSDKPYDQFVKEQIAGDELAPGDLDALAATSYLRHWIYEYNQRDVRTQWSNILNDVTDVTAEVFLGVSLGCARCHDHKFDPLLRKDYYRLQAFFAPLLPRDDLPYADAETVGRYQQQTAAWEAKTADIRRRMATLEATVRQAAANSAINKFPPDIRPMLSKPPAERTPFEHQLAELAYRQVSGEYERLDIAAKLKGEPKAEWLALAKELAAFEKYKPAPLPPAFTVTDVGPVAPATYIPGDRTKQEIRPGFLTVISPGDLELSDSLSASTGRRTALAEWIASPDNPLSVRVIVNRVWQYHFGQGIVSTASDFGRLGEPPSHPELLDWLAHTFVQDGWSMKRLHRLIVTSATYQQSAFSPVANGARLHDPDNRLLWQMPIRRLDAEQIRDAALAVSGELQIPAGGPSGDLKGGRRTIFTKVMRNDRDPVLDAFDAPDNFMSTSSRNVTTTATQSLLMINGPWMLERAQAFAKRLLREPDEPTRVDYGFQLAYGRHPTESQKELAVRFLNRPPDAPAETAESAGFVAFINGGQAIDLNPSRQLNPVMAAGSKIEVGQAFTLEATVLLRSIYDDASVRTIASQWNSDAKRNGWSLGVTSKKSRYEPRNLVLQFVGETKEGQLYEVVPSNLRLELNRPYHVAVTIDLQQTGESGVMFLVRDLADPSRPVQRASASHKIVRIPGPPLPLVIGGRHGQQGHRWDGLVDHVRLTSGTLPEAGLLPHSGADEGTELIGEWKFEVDSGTLHDSSPSGRHLTALSPARPAIELPPALVDFCHVLLNSSEFLYVE